MYRLCSAKAVFGSSMSSRDRNCGLPRAVEICLAAFGLVFTAPLLAISAIVIKLTSSGPAVFRQERVGRNGKTFTLFKLRTMNSCSGALVTAANDSRITAIGKILRRSKIDELPEFWNVVRGDMSIVGPRPEVPEFVNLEDPLWDEILNFRPGLTDPVTLRLRNEEQLLADVQADHSFYKDVIQPYKISGYLHFLRNRSWSTDIKIIYRTLTAIIFPRTAVPPSKEEMLLSLAE